MKHERKSIRNLKKKKYINIKVHNIKEKLMEKIFE